MKSRSPIKVQAKRMPRFHRMSWCIRPQSAAATDGLECLSLKSLSLQVQAVDSIQAAVQEAAAGLESHAERVSKAVAGPLTEKCAVALGQMRGITATYRMTTRPRPTRPSHYLASLLQPLQSLLDAPPASDLQQPAKAEIIQVIRLPGATERRHFSTGMPWQALACTLPEPLPEACSASRLQPDWQLSYSCI